jgi:hypothetical protein
MDEGSQSGEEGRVPAIEVEVERLPEGADARQDGPEDGPPQAPEKLRELGDAVGPVLAGLLIDFLDAATISPVTGLLLGWPLGYYILRQMGLARGTAGKLGAFVALYCAAPGTLVLPIATLVGVGVKVRQVFARKR